MTKNYHVKITETTTLEVEENSTTKAIETAKKLLESGEYTSNIIGSCYKAEIDDVVEVKNIVKFVKSNVNFIKINHTKTNRKNNKSTNKTKINYIKNVKLVIKWATKAPDTPNKTKIKPSACMQKV